MSILQKKGDKITFHIEVKKLLLKKASSLERDTAINVCVERGKHLLTTNDRTCNVTKEGDYMIIFNETLSLDATLYKTNGGLYQDKTGKIMVRKKKKGFMVSGYQSIGSFEIKLNDILDESQPFEKVFLLRECAYPGSSLQVIISLDNGGSVDDDNSLHSSNATSPSVAPSVTANRRPSEMSTAENSANAAKQNGQSANLSSDTSHAGATPAPAKRSGSLTIAPPATAAAPAPAAPAAPVAAPAAPVPHASVLATPPPKAPAAPFNTRERAPTDPFATAANGSGSKGPADPFGEFDPFATAAVGTPGGALDDWGSQQQETSFDWPAAGGDTAHHSFGAFTPAATPNKLPPPVPTNRPPAVPLGGVSTQRPNTTTTAPATAGAAQSAGASVPHSSSSNSLHRSHSLHAGLADPAASPSKPAVVGRENSIRHPKPVRQEAPPIPSSLPPPAPHVPFSTSTSPPLYDPTSPTGVAAAPAPPVLAAPALVAGGAGVPATTAAAVHEDSDHFSSFTERPQHPAFGFDDATHSFGGGSVAAAAAATGNSSTSSNDVESLQEQLDFVKSVIVMQENKLHQASEFIAYQDNQIKVLQSSQDSSGMLSSSTDGSGGSERSQQMEQTIIIQETKLQQAAEYVEFQNAEIQRLNAQVEELLKNNHENHTHSHHTLSGDVNAEEFAALQLKVKQASEYIEFQDSQLAEANATIETLRAAVAGDVDIVELQTKLQKAAEYIAFQTEELDKAQQQIEALQASGVGGNADSEEKLKQAAEYIAYQETTIAELNEQLAAANAAAGASSASVGADLVSEREIINELERKLKQSVEYIEHLKNDAVATTSELAATKEQLEVMISYSNSKGNTPNTTPNKGPGGLKRPTSVPVINEEMSSKLKVILTLKEQLESVTAELKTAEEKLAGLHHTTSTTPPHSAHGSVTSPQSGGSSDESLEEMRQKLEQAKEYIAFQQQQIDELKAAGGDSAELNEKVNQAKEFIDFQTEQFEAAKTQLENLKTDLVALKAQNAELLAMKQKEDHLLAQVKSELESVKGQLHTNSATALAHEQADHSAMQVKLDQAKEFIDYQTAQIEALKEQLTAASTDSDSPPAARNAVMHSDAEFTALQETLNSAKEFSEFQTSQLDSLTKQVATLNQQLREAADKLAVETAKVLDLTASLEASKVDAGKAAEQEVKLQQAADFIAYQGKKLEECEDYLKTVNELMAKHQEDEEKLKQAAEFISFQSKQIEELTALDNTEQTALMSSENDELSTKLEQAKEFVSFQKTQIAELTETVEKLTAVNNANDEKLAQAKEYIDYTNKQIAEQTTEIETLKAELAASAEKLANHDEMLTKLDQAAKYIEYQTGEMAELTDQIEAQSKEIEALKHAAEGHAKSDEKLKKLDAKLKASQAQVESQTTEVNTLKHQVTSLTQRNQELETQQTALEGQKKELTQQVAQLELYVSEIEDKMEAMIKAAKNSSSSSNGNGNSAIMAAQAKEIEQLKQHIEERDGELEKLKETLLKSSTAASNLSVSLETRLKQSAEQVDQLKSQLAAKEAELAKATAAATAAASAGKASETKQVTELNTKLKQAGDYIQQQQKQLEEASQTITSMQDTIDRLTEDSAEYEKAKAALLAAQQEVAQLKQQLQQATTSPSKKTNPFAPASPAAAASPVSPAPQDTKKELQAMAMQYDALLAEKDAELLTLNAKIAELNAAAKEHQRSGSINAGNALDKQHITQYQSTLTHIAEKLILLLPKQANAKLDYEIDKISPKEASKLLMGLTDTIIGFYKDGVSNVQAAVDQKMWEAKLAEKDADQEKLLQSLIETKMTLAQISGELDMERKTCTQLRRQLGHRK